MQLATISSAPRSRFGFLRQCRESVQSVISEGRAGWYQGYLCSCMFQALRRASLKGPGLPIPHASLALREGTSYFFIAGGSSENIELKVVIKLKWRHLYRELK